MRKRSFVGSVMLAAVLVVASAAWAAPEAASAPAASAPAGATPTSAGPATAPVATESKTQNLIEWFQSGGWVMWVLLGFSVVGLAVTLERLFMLRRGVIVPAGLMRQATALWKQGRYDELNRLAEGSRSTLGRIITFVVDHRDSPLTEINVGAGDIASAEHRRLMSRFGLLSVITMASPLTGLLGTVGAMIEAFRNIVNAGKLGSAAVLYASISTALVTTEAGLMVAIPALILYHYFKLRTNGMAGLVDQETTAMLNDWFMARAKKV